jgi:hypothetical protein
LSGYRLRVRYAHHSLDVGHLAYARFTHPTAFVGNGGRFGAAEEAQILSLFQDHPLALDADVQLVPFVDSKNLADLGGQHDTTEFIDLSHYAGRLQIPPPGW